MRKLLFYNDAIHVGGHEYLAVKAAEYLVTQDYNITFIISKHNSTLHEMLAKIEKISIVKVDIKTSRYQILKNFVDIKRLLYLKKKIKEINPDMIIPIQGNIEMSSSVLFAAKASDIPIATYIPLTYFLSDISKNKFIAKIKDRINYLYFQIPDYYITINEGMKQHICERNISEEKIMVVRNGIDLSKYDILPQNEAKKKLNLPSDVFTYALVGRVESYHKGHDFLLAMVNKYKKDFTGSVFLIAGDGEYKAEMERKVNKLGLDKYFIFLGNVSNTSIVYSAIDALVLPSRYEGYEGTPLVLYESLYFNKKVCASKIRGIKGLLPDNWVFDVGNLDEMKDVILSIQQDDNEVEKIKNEITTNFTIDKFQKKFHEAIKKLRVFYHEEV